MSGEAKVRIVSDGTPGGTRVLVDDDRELPATYLKLEVDARGQTNCVIHLANVAVEYEGPATFRLQENPAKDINERLREDAADGRLPVGRAPKKQLTEAGRRHVEGLLRRYQAERSSPIVVDSDNDRIVNGDRKQ